ncbi:MAG: type II toxin-antitoxin system CcdA family antitoxin [Acidobacteria bacterium]|nr:type II toxin-antitoxin system CcdA family antitoxin [Acidobacteriota bacterium]
MYTMRMARINVYLPDDLALKVKAADLNVSRLAQEALRSALAASRVDDWLDDVGSLGSLGIDPALVVSAVTAAKDELDGRG